VAQLARQFKQLDIQICPDDFGQTPIGLACFVDDSSTVTTFGLIAGLVAAAMAGPLAGCVVVFAIINDVIYLKNLHQGTIRQHRETMRVIRDLEDAPIVRAQTPQEAIAQMGKEIYSQLSSAERAEVAELYKQYGAARTLNRLAHDMGITPEQIEQHWPGALTLLRPSAVTQQPIAALPVTQIQGPEFSAPTHSRSRMLEVLPTDRDSLLAKLKQDCPLLVQLLQAPPIRLVGAQRTGKSTLGKLLALLRLIVLPGHEVVASTPHYEPENPYPQSFEIVGIKDGQRDYAAIGYEWASMAGRIYRGERSSVTTIWDEFGLMDQVIDPDELLSVVKSSLREASKHGEFPIFIVHGETLAFLPGVKGLVEPFLKSTVRVETIGAMVDGANGLPQMQPTGRFSVQWLDGNQANGEIPRWLTEGLLSSLLPQKATPKAAPSIVPVTQADPDPWEAAEATTKAASPSDTLVKLSAAGITIEDLKALLSNVQ
jgi:hypothetical protein